MNAVEFDGQERRNTATRDDRFTENGWEGILSDGGRLVESPQFVLLTDCQTEGRPLARDNCIKKLNFGGLALDRESKRRFVNMIHQSLEAFEAENAGENERIINMADTVHNTGHRNSVPLEG